MALSPFSYIAICISVLADFMVYEGLSLHGSFSSLVHVQLNMFGEIFFHEAILQKVETHDLYHKMQNR